MPQTTVTICIDATYVLKVMKELRDDLAKMGIDAKPAIDATEAYHNFEKACRNVLFIADSNVARMVRSFQEYELSKLKEEANNETL